MTTQAFLSLFSQSLTEERVFSYLMADIPAGVGDHLKRWQDLIDPKDLHGPDLGLEDHFHVTVLYGIHDPSPYKVKKLLAEQHKFSIKLGDISLFENAKYDVVKVDIESGELVQINKLLRHNLQHTLTFPEYHPHLTLAYVKKGTGKKYVGKGLTGVELEVKSFTFSTPEGKKIQIPITRR
jgi:2'-5' RNA ligase